MAHELLDLAYSVIKFELDKKELEVSKDLQQKYSKPQGVFVTITKNNLPRGQAGFVESMLPLWKALVLATKTAAFNDNEFPVVSHLELKEIKLTIQLISNLKHFENNLQNNQGILLQSLSGESILFPNQIKQFSRNLDETLEFLYKKANVIEEDTSVKIYTFDVKEINRKS